MTSTPTHPGADRAVRAALAAASRLFALFALFTLCWLATALSPSLAEEEPPSHPLEFIDLSIENASPLWHDLAEDGTVNLHLLYDHERDSPNRAAGHIHFLVHAQPGAELAFEFFNLDNVWNHRPGSVARELKLVVVSENGRDWTPVPLQSLPDNRVRLELTMPGPRLHVARCEPYRLSDHERFLDEIREHPLVAIEERGRTVEGRSLEIVRVGDPEAARSVFLRARSHPWEPGGNWVVEGLVRRLLRGDAEAQRFLEGYCVYLQPMANKDGVVRGMTRFNLKGKDLNRDWNDPADPDLAPENAALEEWLEERIAAGRAPDLAICLHNDGGGRLHLSRPPVPELDAHLERMGRFEALLREHTWFTEGSTGGEFRNAGTLGEGWLMRYGIDALIAELNCNWIAGLEDYPSAKHWMDYGEGLARVFHDYFSE